MAIQTLTQTGAEVQATLNDVANKVDTNDSRLSDARTPTAHNHTKSEITDFSDSDYATAAQGNKADTAVQPADYASSTVGGTLKARLDGTTLYLRNDGTNA